MNHKYRLYSYWRSSASWRVRWALELKKIPYECQYINLLKAENLSQEYISKNPSGLLPLLEKPDGQTLSQSMAILLYLESEHPQISLLGSSNWEKFKIIEFSEIINADTAPLQTPRAQKKHSSDENEKKKWAQHFIYSGLKVCNDILPKQNSIFTFGANLSLADIFLIPQIYNALRYEVPVEKDFPKLMQIYKNAMATHECLLASPAQQGDAQK